MGSATIQDRNKQLVREATAALDRGDFDAFRDGLSADHVCHYMDYKSMDRDALIEDIKIGRAPFADATTVIDDLVAEGDKVAYRITFQGTHTGTYWDVPPTGRKITFSELHIATIVDGKFKETWALSTVFGPMRQMGMELRPAPAVD